VVAGITTEEFGAVRAQTLSRPCGEHEGALIGMFGFFVGDEDSEGDDIAGNLDILLTLPRQRHAFGDAECGDGGEKVGEFDLAFLDTVLGADFHDQCAVLGGFQSDDRALGYENRILAAIGFQRLPKLSGFQGYFADFLNHDTPQLLLLCWKARIR